MKLFNWIIFTFCLFSLQLIQAQQELHQQATTLFDDGKYKEVVELLSPQIKIQDSEPEIVFVYAKGLLKTGAFEDAIKHMKPLKKTFSDQSDFYFWYGQAYLAKLNESKNFFEKGIVASKVKEAFEKSVDLDPENLTARNSLARYYMEAPAIAGGSLKKAKEQIDYIKGKDPGMGYNTMANYYFQKKEYPLAQEEYLNFLEVASDKSPILYQIGFIYQIEKNYEEAFQYFEKSINTSPAFVPSYYQYARTAIFAEKNIVKAIKAMQTYIDQEGNVTGPDIPSAYWRLGMLYELQQQPSKAKQMYQQALAINPDHPQAKEALEKL